jgi:hypothetical protein
MASLSHTSKLSLFRGAMNVSVLLTAAISCAVVTDSNAQTSNKAQESTQQKSSRLDAPDGAPQLPRETVVSDKSSDPKSEVRGSIIESTERVQGRLATERVSTGGGQSYLIVDPNAGRVDRAATNSGRRTVPSQWELFRF